MALSDRPAERHQQVAGLFTERVRATRSWDVPSPVPGWAARDVVRHLTDWFPAFLASNDADLSDFWVTIFEIVAWGAVIPGLVFSFIAFFGYFPRGLRALRAGREARHATAEAI